MGPIAKELQDRLFYLADPKVKWVQGTPSCGTQACLVQNADGYELSAAAFDWLDGFVDEYAAYADITWSTSAEWQVLGPGAVTYNDHVASSRRDVLLMLEEAIDQAKWEGV